MANKAETVLPEVEEPSPQRFVVIDGTPVPINPKTGRPQPGSIVGGERGAHKILWTETDVRAQFPNVTWYNYGSLREVTFNGVKLRFGSGEVTTPSIARDLAYDSYRAQGLGEEFVRRTGGQVTTGALEPREA